MKLTENLWCCVLSDGKNFTYQLSSLSYWRKVATSKFLTGTTLTWKEAKKMGWRCVKVALSFPETVIKS